MQIIKKIKKKIIQVNIKFDFIYAYHVIPTVYDFLMPLHFLNILKIIQYFWELMFHHYVTIFTKIAYTCDINF